MAVADMREADGGSARRERAVKTAVIAVVVGLQLAWVAAFVYAAYVLL
ncbi:MAG TPA: hypothetical protein VGC78_04340 [Gaiellaceae bacterium]|jgi:hypothetical protein